MKARGLDLLIVDDEPSVTKIFERLAKQEKLSFEVAANGYEALDKLGKNDVGVVILDICMPGLSGFQVLEYIRTNCSESEVIVMTGKAKVEDAVKALKMGAFDFITKPFENLEIVISCLKQALEKTQLKHKIKSLEKGNLCLEAYEGILGKSKPMQEVYETIQNVGPSASSALILGESGTGKELVARAIHQVSPRKNKNFVVINCSAIPEGLMESELFGHTRGSFTGATHDKLGLFEEANGGTVFLDEIGEIPLSIQVKLLRVLQEREVRRVGSTELRHVDVRIISATHQDLTELIKKGSFREDLYYRLNVIGILMPPLRERGEDIPLLAYHFLKKFNEKTGKNIQEISVDALHMLQGYNWTGNVRELENIIERCVVLSEGDIIQAKDLPAKLLTKNFYLPSNQEEDLSQFSYQDAKEKALEVFNKNYLNHILKVSHGNISLASLKAGMDRSNFKKIIRKYEIDLSDYKGEENEAGRS